MANFVGVRTAYYKHNTAGQTRKGRRVNSALTLLDHVHAPRDGQTRSRNVVPELTGNNRGLYPAGFRSAREAYDAARARHQAVTGRAPRHDMNTLFESIVVLSLGRYESLERELGEAGAANAVLSGAQRYCDAIQAEFGFTPLGMDLHLDEGHIDRETGEFRRNIHIQCQFYNYDFERKISPLRQLMVKGTDAAGRTNELNPNFVRMQDIAGESFAPLGYRRGVSRSITGRDHQVKSEYVDSMIDLTIPQLRAEADRLRSEGQKLLAGVEQLNKLAQNASERLRAIISPIAGVLHQMANGVDLERVRELQRHIATYDRESRELLPQSAVRPVLEQVDATIKPFRNKPTP